MATPEENDILKRLSWRRRRLVNERGRVLNSRRVQRLQPLELLHRHIHDDRRAALGDHPRLGTGGVDQPAEVAFGVLRRRRR